jgi:hypothetical protein
MAKAKCKVVFENDARGTDALLKSGRHVLNLIHMGRDPSPASKRRARVRLMKGCAELLRDYSRK